MSTYSGNGLSTRSTAAASWLATLAVCGGAIYALHQVGNVDGLAVEWSDLWGWLGSHGLEVVLMALARVAGLILAYWIAASLVATTVARAMRSPLLIRSVELMTLPAIRRLAERSVAFSLSVATLTTGALGPAVTSTGIPEDEARPAVALAFDAGDAGTVRYVPVPTGDGFASDGEQLPAPEASAAGTGTQDDQTSVTDVSYVPIPAGTQRDIPLAPTAPAAAAAPRLFEPASADRLARFAARFADQAYEHAVVTGDNLWTIAERHLHMVLDRAATDPEIATYWSHLIDVNREGIRSGDPDLIFPGEVVVCPPATDVGMTG